ncbi:putative sugar kinase YdjH [Thalassoglobus neptunius]|uniref:Putative sugar kinase YdjH n=1 Tax=Thalassoglobus neptunius TaxID=1938619 RepID=A0A5C5XA73_9PLAN|nr:carbohydrate kinase family protein [Thalassoglobus neptunius]TWT58762.1 putative sugar kinase YdjH [Thalassoglobus neptunius]
MKPSQLSCDVVCLGLIVADHVCAPIRKIPAPGGLITTPELRLTIGGCAANASTDMARLGLSVELVGLVGDDPFGNVVIEELRSNGVRCEHVKRLTDQATAATMVINVHGEDRRFIHAVGANTQLTGNEVSNELLSSAKALVVGGFGLNPSLSGENVRDLFSRARDSSVVTVLDVVLDDVDMCRTMLKDALPETDYFLPNSDEARLLTGTSDIQQQARILLDWGARAVVITRGASGVILADQTGAVKEVPAFSVTQVDGTGGGDAFVSGFVYALLKELPPQTCMRYGAAMGASCVQHSGATTGVFNSQELEEFIRSQKCAEDE